MNLKVLILFSLLATVFSQNLRTSTKHVKKQRTEEEKRRFREWVFLFLFSLSFQNIGYELNKQKQKKSKEPLSQLILNKSDEAALDAFANNLQLIESFNKRKNETYKQGLTDDSHLTFEEKRKRRLGLKRPGNSGKEKRNVGSSSTSQIGTNKTIIAPKSRK